MCIEVLTKPQVCAWEFNCWAGTLIYTCSRVLVVRVDRDSARLTFSSLTLDVIGILPNLQRLDLGFFPTHNQ